MSERRAVLAAGLAAFLAACGQTGPLYLPGEARGVVTRPSQTAPASETGEAPNSPRTPDSPAQPDSPAPEVTAPSPGSDADDDEAKPGTPPPKP